MLMRWEDQRCACCTSWQIPPWQLRRSHVWHLQLFLPFWQQPGTPPFSCLDVGCARKVFSAYVYPHSAAHFSCTSLIFSWD